MKIRKLEKSDIVEVVELWYRTSISAHGFISADYWYKNKEPMANIYLPNSETWLAVEDEQITGFISMANDYLAAIFVDPGVQGKGIGKMLLEFVKEKRAEIQLKVYKKNIKTLEFYKRQGFRILSEGRDEDTGENEYLMIWES